MDFFPVEICLYRFRRVLFQSFTSGVISTKNGIFYVYNLRCCTIVYYPPIKVGYTSETLLPMLEHSRTSWMNKFILQMNIALFLEQIFLIEKKKKKTHDG